MPIRLLVWNIQGFSLNKISALKMVKESTKIGNQKYFYEVSQRRLRYILKNIELKNPDIFSVIEVISGQGQFGSLVSSNGALGCQLLLRKLKELDPNWCLIPPIKLVDKVAIEEAVPGYKKLVKDKAYTEGIGVFYRQDKLDFIGPYIWPKTKDPNDPLIMAEPNDGTRTPGPYPKAWKKCLPDKNYFAGQYEFFDVTGNEIFFPSQESRTPFMVQFNEAGGKKRLITLVSLHLPPHEANARTALAWVADYFRKNATANNELLLIAGDVNMDANYHAFRDDAIIGSHAGDILTPLFDDNSSPRSSLNYTKAWAVASKYLKPLKLIDNVLYRYGGPNAKDGKITAEVIDRVKNTSLLTTPLAQIKKITPKKKQDEVFRNYLNFGQLTGTSDHLALFVEI